MWTSARYAHCSKWTNPRPNGGMIDWLAEADEDRIFISAITWAEVRCGIESLPTAPDGDRLHAWLTEDLPLCFEAQILPIDADVGDWRGRIMARGRPAGRIVGAMDAFIAATSERYNLPLPTRDV